MLQRRNEGTNRATDGEQRDVAERGAGRRRAIPVAAGLVAAAALGAVLAMASPALATGAAAAAPAPAPAQAAVGQGPADATPTRATAADRAACPGFVDADGDGTCDNLGTAACRYAGAGTCDGTGCGAGNGACDGTGQRDRLRNGSRDSSGDGTGTCDGTGARQGGGHHGRSAGAGRRGRG